MEIGNWNQELNGKLKLKIDYEDQIWRLKLKVEIKLIIQLKIELKI